jgi:hypothetical protein
MEKKNSEESNVLKRISKNFEVIRQKEEGEKRYEEDFTTFKEKEKDLVYP